MQVIDLRSDTVTLPSKKIRQAIFDAELGDDVFQEDKNVNLLEKQAAGISGKEAALLVPSGTMGNLISFLVHCQRGTEAILGNKSHTFIYEAGGISAFGGIHSHQLNNTDDGLIDIELIKKAIRIDNVHFPQTSLISLENTHNMCFGSPISKDYIDQVSNIAKENNLKLHIDGARIFNATTALKISLADMIQNVDSVTFCLSKGLSCPIGSIICGSKEFIYSARRMRKVLGGGMRQAGIIAAAGLVAINQIEEQISEDHNNAQLLAEGLNEINGLHIELNKVKTNIVYFELQSDSLSSKELLKEMNDKSILFFEVSPNRYRLVTHYGISKTDISFILKTFEEVLS
jgi:threonine aldolase